jgi:hypothetical protein
MTCEEFIIPGHPKNTQLTQQLRIRSNGTLKFDFPRIPGPRPRLQNSLNPLCATKQILCSRRHLRSGLAISRPRPRLSSKTRLLT